MWEKIDATAEVIGNVNTSLAKLEGKIAGAVWAAGAVGALVGAVVGVVMQLLKGAKL